MSFGNRSLQNARRPAVNIIGGGRRGINVEDDDPNKKYCPRCQFNLYYYEEKDTWFCGRCAWNMPDELSKKNQDLQQQKQQQQQEVAVKVAATTAADAVNKEQGSHTVSMGTRASQKRKDQFDYLRRDDDIYTKKLGWVPVTDIIEFADDRKTVSSEDLKKEKARLRGKTIR